jgi:hypothetical protein
MKKDTATNYLQKKKKQAITKNQIVPLRASC